MGLSKTHHSAKPESLQKGRCHGILLYIVLKLLRGDFYASAPKLVFDGGIHLGELYRQAEGVKNELGIVICQWRLPLQLKMFGFQGGKL